MTDAAHADRFAPLVDFLARIPAVETTDTPSLGIGSGEEAGGWWVKFSIDIDSEIAWETVQEMAHVLNTLSIEERLATVFKPVSPPPYLNGGPEEFLSWVIEGTDAMEPSVVAGWLEERLPKPVEDEDAWLGERDEDDASGNDDDEDDEDDAEAFGDLEDDD
jgi:hypothetical protein